MILLGADIFSNERKNGREKSITHCICLVSVKAEFLFVVRYVCACVMCASVRASFSMYGHPANIIAILCRFLFHLYCHSAEYDYWIADTFFFTYSLQHTTNRTQLKTEQRNAWWAQLSIRRRKRLIHTPKREKIIISRQKKQQTHTHNTKERSWDRK